MSPPPSVLSSAAPTDSRAVLRRGAWTVVMLLSTAVACYACWLFVSSSAWPPFLHTSPAPRAVLLHLAGGGLALLRVVLLRADPADGGVDHSADG